MKTFKLSALLLSLLAIFAVAPAFGAAGDMYEEYKKITEAIVKGLHEIDYVVFKHTINNGGLDGKSWKKLNENDAKYLVETLIPELNIEDHATAKEHAIKSLTKAFQKDFLTDVYKTIADHAKATVTEFNNMYEGRHEALEIPVFSQDAMTPPTVKIYLPSDNGKELIAREEGEEPTGSGSKALTGGGSKEAASELSKISQSGPLNLNDLTIIYKNIRSDSGKKNEVKSNLDLVSRISDATNSLDRDTGKIAGKIIGILGIVAPGTTPTSATTSPASSSAASSSAASGASPYNEAELKLLQKRIHSASNTTPYKNDPTIKARLGATTGPLADAIRKKLGIEGRPAAASETAATAAPASGASPYNEAELELLQRRIGSAGDVAPYKNDPAIRARLGATTGPLADAIRKKLGL